MESYRVRCIAEKIKPNTSIQVTVPGSKSMTNRALLLATLAKGESLLKGALFSQDSRVFLKCIQDLGFEASADEEKKQISVKGLGGAVPKQEASVYVGSAGTAARFLTAYLGVCQGTYHLDSSEQMKKRPMAPLLESLQQLGCEITYEGEEGFFPFTLSGKKRMGTKQISVDIEHSSQFLSALLIAACQTGKEGETLSITVVGKHGMSYIDMTLQMMEQFGIQVERDGENTFRLSACASYQPLQYQIEPDVSAACYFYGMAAILGVSAKVMHVHFDTIQGDIEFLRIMERMGCSLKEEKDGIVLYPPKDGVLRGGTFDMHSCSDQAITVAAISCFADSPVRIEGIGHIRYQESNRIEAICTELGKIGIRCEESETGITIYPGKPKPSRVETYDDHRMAMGFSLIGLRAEGIEILDPGCCRKTFENYFQVLDFAIADLL